MRVGRLKAVDVGGMLDHVDGVRRLAERPLHLLVVGVADQHDAVAVAREAPRLDVHLVDEGAGGVDDAQLPRVGIGAHLRRDPVRGEYDEAAVGHLVELLHEDRATCLEVAHHVRVVHDLAAHVDRRPVPVERALDDLDRAVDAGTERAWSGEQHRARAARRRPLLEHRRGAAQGAVGAHTAREHGGRRQRELGAVDDGAYDRERSAREARHEPRRLHVDGDGAGVARGGARPAADEAGRRQERPDLGHEAGATEGVGDQRRRRQRHRAVGATHLVGHEELARREGAVERAAEAEHGDRVVGHGGTGELVGGADGAGGAIPADHDAGVARAGADGAALDAQRCDRDQRPRRRLHRRSPR